MSLLAWLVAAAFLIGTGFIGGAKFVHAQWNAAKLAQLEVNQETQRLAVRGSTKATDVFNAQNAAAAATARASRDELNRVRNALANQPVGSPAAGCDADAERNARLSRLLDESASLVEEGSGRVGVLAARLEGLQTYVTGVCQVTGPKAAQGP